MQDEKKALDELLFIKKVIEDSKKITGDNGMGYIVWGILVAIGQVLGYFKFKFNMEFNFVWAWVIIITIGWIFSFFAYYKKDRHRIKTFAGKIIGTLWLALGISMTLIGFVGNFSGAIPGEGIGAIMAAILGSAYFITSVLCDQKWLKAVAALWWVGFIALCYVNSVNLFLIMAFLMIFGQVVPGLIIYRNYKKQQGIQ